jgi:imidazolonepropionase-like amidohydrolase
MLVGTDASNPLMVAGFSVHDELDALVNYAGFTRFEAIVAATRNVAKFLGDSTGGRIVAGARADVILVARNPLEDHTTLRKPIGVMVGGRWLDSASLNSALTTSVRKQTPK